MKLINRFARMEILKEYEHVCSSRYATFSKITCIEMQETTSLSLNKSKKDELW